MKTIDEAVAMLNEAVTLSPALWSLFDVQVPCDRVVGLTTDLELMAFPTIAFANLLGVINALYSNSNERITIVTGDSVGERRKFIRTTISVTPSR